MKVFRFFSFSLEVIISRENKFPIYLVYILNNIKYRQYANFKKRISYCRYHFNITISGFTYYRGESRVNSLLLYCRCISRNIINRDYYILRGQNVGKE